MSDGDQVEIRRTLDKVLEVMIEIRDLLKHVVKADMIHHQFTPPTPQQGQMALGVRVPKDVACPFFKAAVGQPCSNDPTKPRSSATDSSTTRAV